MKKTLIILILLVATAMSVTTTARAQETATAVIALNDSLSVQVREITRDEYDTRRQASAHLQHKPYKAVTDFDSAVQMLGGRLKETGRTEDGVDYDTCCYELTFTDGTTLRLDADYTFMAWFPQLQILFFEGGHSSQYMFDLRDGSSVAGNPFHHAISPDKKWRINGFHDGQDTLLRFLEKWNYAEEKYEIVDYFIDYDNPEFGYSGNYFWTDNDTAIFTNFGGMEVEHISEDTEFYELTIIENTSRP